MTKERLTYEILKEQTETGIRILYERYGKKLCSYAIHQWKLDEDEAWDLTYKTLYRVLDAYSSYQFVSEQKFGAFVFTTFINYLRNHYRDTKKKKSETVPLDESHLAVQQMQDDGNVSVPMEIMREALDKMEDWERMLLLLRSQDLPYSEIARLTGKPENQLKVYYMRLKKKLADSINQKLNEIKTDAHGKSA